MASEATQRADVEILIAEDSATQAEVLSHLLEQAGYRVTAVRNGRLALEAARRRRPTLIITDVVMPEMDGAAFCKAIKQDRDLREVPVIMVTTLSSIQDIVMALECGADHFLRKPYDAANLLARIEHTLAQWNPRDDEAPAAGIEVLLAGTKYGITSGRKQILDLLISSYEQAVLVNEELKRREQEVRILNRDLERRAAELLAVNQELESFSYSVSHDLRAPLRAVSGYARILEEEHGEALGAEGRSLLDTVTTNAHRMGHLIDDLLAFSRWARAPIQVRRIDMTALAQAAHAELSAAGDAPTADVRIDPLPAAWGGESLVRQVWVNLLSNALKYSGMQPQPQIVVTGRVEGPQAIYCVADNGAGFDMRYADKLFGVFQRLHGQDEFPGTGVGLAIVRKIVTRHGGRVWAEAEVGAGARFYFSLPAGPDADER